MESDCQLQGTDNRHHCTGPSPVRSRLMYCSMKANSRCQDERRSLDRFRTSLEFASPCCSLSELDCFACFLFRNRVVCPCWSTLGKLNVVNIIIKREHGNGLETREKSGIEEQTISGRKMLCIAISPAKKNASPIPMYRKYILRGRPAGLLKIRALSIKDGFWSIFLILSQDPCLTNQEAGFALLGLGISHSILLLLTSLASLSHVRSLRSNSCKQKRLSIARANQRKENNPKQKQTAQENHSAAIGACNKHERQTNEKKVYCDDWPVIVFSFIPPIPSHGATHVTDSPCSFGLYLSHIYLFHSGI